jgi:hypothetical protein
MLAVTLRAAARDHRQPALLNAETDGPQAGNLAIRAAGEAG